MFQRYTDETKRAIYFAAQLALYEGAAVIDSAFLLRGLLTDTESRANSIFRLCQLFPEDAAKQSMLKGQQVNNTCELTIKEASRQSALKKQKVAPNIREGENAAAGRLRSTGLDLETSRQRVIESKSSRPTRPDPVLWWARRHPLGIVLPVVFCLGVIVALILLGFGGTR